MNKGLCNLKGGRSGDHGDCNSGDLMFLNYDVISRKHVIACLKAYVIYG